MFMEDNNLTMTNIYAPWMRYNASIEHWLNLSKPIYSIVHCVWNPPEYDNDWWKYPLVPQEWHGGTAASVSGVTVREDYYNRRANEGLSCQRWIQLCSTSWAARSCLRRRRRRLKEAAEIILKSLMGNIQTFSPAIKPSKTTLPSDTEERGMWII